MAQKADPDIAAHINKASLDTTHKSEGQDVDSAQLEKRLARFEQRAQELDEKIAELNRNVESFQLALQGNKAYGIEGIVDKIDKVYALAQSTAEAVSKAKWILIGGIAAGQGVSYLVEAFLSSIK